MKRLIGSLAVLALAAAATVGVGSAATATTGANQPLSAEQTYYRTDLRTPVSSAAVLAAARGNHLNIVSVRYGDNETSGELIVGDTPLVDAMTMYDQTTLQNFDRMPHAQSFVTTNPPPDDLVIGGMTPLRINQVALSSTDMTSDEGDVTAASIEKPWAPDYGTVWAHNSSTGSPRQVRQRLAWKSRAGLDSYNDFAYEHDNKLHDPDARLGTIPGGGTVCVSNHWVAHSNTTIVTSDMPSGAGVYADNARQLENCGVYDISFGILYPGKLAINKTYTVVVGGKAGPKPSSPTGLSAQKLSNDCQFLPDGDYCIGLNERRPGTDSEPLIGYQRGWPFPGCYTWTKGSAPTRGTC